MTTSPDRRRASAHGLCTAGTVLALACAKNVYAAVDRRSPEAGALATWLGQSATAFGLPDSAPPPSQLHFPLPLPITPYRNREAELGSTSNFVTFNPSISVIVLTGMPRTGAFARVRDPGADEVQHPPKERQ